MLEIDGASEGVDEGISEGAVLIVGIMLIDGAILAISDGAGEIVGDSDALITGGLVPKTGALVGVLVGLRVGPKVGAGVVGARVPTIGIKVGPMVGRAVGPKVGRRVGDGVTGASVGDPGVGVGL